MLHFILEGQLTKDAVLFFQQKLQKTLSLDLKELGYGSNQKRDFHAGTPAHFLFKYSFTSAAVSLERPGEHVPVTGHYRRQKRR